ncbi:MAG: hypothetical protein WKF79_01970 [Nocardioides sp.]
MRALGTVLVTLASLLAVALPVASAASADPDRECRAQWVDLAQLHGENGNPGGSARVLNRRWDAVAAEAARLAEEATAADCAGFEAYAASWDGLERLQYAVKRHDYPFLLRLARGDLRHYREFNGRNPAPRVLRAFRFLTRQAPRADDDLDPVVARVGDVDTGRRVEINDFLADYRDAARASDAAQRSKRWLEIIERAELHEE